MSTPLAHDLIGTVVGNLDLETALRLRVTSSHYRDGVDSLLKSLWNEIIKMRPTQNFYFGAIAGKVNADLKTTISKKDIIMYFEVFEKACAQHYRESLFHGGIPLRIHELEEKQRLLQQQLPDKNLQIFWTALRMSTTEPVRTATEIRAWLANPDYQERIDVIGNIGLRHNLTAFPLEILHFRNLMFLDVSRNWLSSLPTEIGQLRGLESLNISHNQISCLPAEIGQLTNLQSLNISHNCFQHPLPTEIGQLINLKRLNISHSQLTSLPVELGQLRNLKRLNISGNFLLSFPAEIGQLTHLEKLDVSHNWLISLPAGGLVELINLKRLRVSNNQLSLLPQEELTQLIDDGILEIVE